MAKISAVSVRPSVRPDHLVCLVCGKRFKSLRRHLQTAHGLPPAAYRKMFVLRPDYALIAAAAPEQRAAIARRIGLAQRRPPEPAPESAAKARQAPRAARKAEAATTGEAAPKPTRTPGTAKKTEPTPA